MRRARPARTKRRAETQQPYASMQLKRTVFAVALAVMLPAAAGAADSAADSAAVSPREAIGWRLFFDPILSRPSNTACATCHIPGHGYEQGTSFGKGAHSDTLPVNTPTVVNLQDASFFFWDGRAASLEEQAKGPIANRIEMDLTHEEAAARVGADPEYRQAFGAIGVKEITIDDIVGAIAAFERKLVTGETLFDRWLQGERRVLSESQERGRMIFFTRGQCALCHMGRNFTDGDFHNVSTGSEKDLGRYNVTQDEEDKGRFKVPSLRNWKGREPLMHDGRFQTIRDVIDHYNDPPDATVGEAEIDPLDFSKDEVDDLIAFLETLNGPWPDLTPFREAWQKLMAGK